MDIQLYDFFLYSSGINMHKQYNTGYEFIDIDSNNYNISDPLKDVFFLPEDMELLEEFFNEK